MGKTASTKLEDATMRYAVIAGAILLGAVPGLPARADTGTAAGAPVSRADGALVAKSCKCVWSQRNDDPNSGLWICTLPPGCRAAAPVRRPAR